MLLTDHKMLAQAKAVQILAKLPVFAGLVADEHFKVLRMCSSKGMAAGEVVFKQGDDASSLFILLSGEVEINVEGKGTVHVMKAGEIMGEIGLVCKTTRSATAVTRNDVVMLELFADILHDVVKKSPQIGYVIMRNIAGILGNRVLSSNQK